MNSVTGIAFPLAALSVVLIVGEPGCSKSRMQCRANGNTVMCVNAFGFRYTLQENDPNGGATVACFSDGRIWPSRVEVSGVRCYAEDAPR